MHNRESLAMSFLERQFSATPAIHATPDSVPAIPIIAALRALIRANPSWRAPPLHALRQRYRDQMHAQTPATVLAIALPVKGLEDSSIK
jgi:hypothetical protein